MSSVGVYVTGVQVPRGQKKVMGPLGAGATGRVHAESPDIECWELSSGPAAWLSPAGSAVSSEFLQLA